MFLQNKRQIIEQNFPGTFHEKLVNIDFRSLIEVGINGSHWDENAKKHMKISYF